MRVSYELQIKLFCWVLLAAATFGNSPLINASTTNDDSSVANEELVSASDESDDLLLDDDELLLDEDDDLLADDDSIDTDSGDASTGEQELPEAFIEHAKLFAEDRYPSATTCRTCHEQHYREWSVSQHAYALLSPVFNSLHGVILKKTSGTNGDFCIRCHTPIGMNIKEPLFASAMDRHPASREGITCVVCHRINKAYGKVSGRLALVKGSLLDPVYGPKGNAELKRVLANPDQYRVVTKADKAGRKIHADIKRFFPLTTSGFCGSCHDVTLVNGFRLEEAFSEYKHSPAAANNIPCQDCHMGAKPGQASGYTLAPAAIVGGVPTKVRKHTNHYFAGPDHSIVHPGIFPHNTKAQELATMAQWLTFDVEAGWGTDAYEDNANENFVYPERWSSIDDRYDARQIIDENLKLLSWANEQRRAILQHAFLLGEPKLQQASANGIVFTIKVKNGTDGHNIPTGFDAERLVWLHVVVTDDNGNIVMQSGDLDPNGDVRDSHSLYVHNHELPIDKQLLNLQSRFVVRMNRGGEREQIIPINYSPDPLPFLRRPAMSNILQGQPLGARKHRMGIAANSYRLAKYKVDKKMLTGNGPYHALIELKLAMVPINLLSEIVEVGLDFDMSPRQAADAIKDGHMVLAKRELTINIGE